MRNFKKDSIPELKSDVAHKISAFIEADDKPLILEVGAGVGMHALQWAQANPQQKMISVERTQEKMSKFNQRFINHKIKHPELFDNLLPLHADAISVVVHGLKDDSIEQVYFLYPNPELKNKAQRWINRPFFSEIIRVLKKGGLIEFRTNILSYKNELLEKYSEWPLKMTYIAEVAPTEKPKTHFEKKYLSRGETCFVLQFTKIE